MEIQLLFCRKSIYKVIVYENIKYNFIFTQETGNDKKTYQTQHVRGTIVCTADKLSSLAAAMV